MPSSGLSRGSIICTPVPIGLAFEYFKLLITEEKTAILVDGTYYRKMANFHGGMKSAEDRAEELIKYCKCHLTDKNSFVYSIR